MNSSTAFQLSNLQKHPTYPVKGLELSTFQSPSLDTFRGFPLADFQRDAIREIRKENHVMIVAPTGTGKTLPADFAIGLCLSKGQKAIYTAPIKALSEQMFNEFREKYGENEVGLVTGDRVVNNQAPILIMTAEVLSNLTLEDPDQLKDVKYFIIDETHLLGDEERGKVYEKTIIHKPKDTRLLMLSATIPDAKKVCDWINYIHNEEVVLIESKKRFVEQEHRYFDREKGLLKQSDIVGMLSTGLDIETLNATHTDLVKYASRENILPVLSFSFSRKQCEAYAKELSRDYEISLVEPDEIKQIKEAIIKHEEKFPALNELSTWRELKPILEKGVGYHHAGLLPAIKPLIEDLFKRELVKVLYATETYAMGINNPVKTVCFTELTKFDGEVFRVLTGTEYLQMSGRAGRIRSKNRKNIGHVISLVKPRFFKETKRIPDLDAFQSEGVKSNYAYSYNDVLNLSSKFTQEQIFSFFNMSLASFLHAREMDKCKNEIEKATAALNNSRPVNPPQKAGGKKLKAKDRRKIEKTNREIENQQNCIAALKKIYNKGKNETPVMRLKKEFFGKYDILEKFGHIKGNTFLPRGKACSEMHIHELLVTELVYEGVFHELDEDEINGLLACITVERGDKIETSILHEFDFSQVEGIAKGIAEAEAKHGLDSKFTLSKQAFPIMYKWSQGCKLDDITSKSNLQDGDIISLSKSVLDLLKQIRKTNFDDKGLVDKLNECENRISRDFLRLGA